LKLLRRQDDGYPSQRTFTDRFGTFSRLRSEARRWAKQQGQFVDVLEILPTESEDIEEQNHSASCDGWVYLLKSGDHYKLGRGKDLERRIKQDAVALPEEISLVHAIRTDDPPGIETYWHRRFSDKRVRGEWFKLSAQDVRAFKRRKFQ